MDDPNCSILHDLAIPYELYTPDNSMFLIFHNINKFLRNHGMTSKTIIYKLLYYILLDIRIEAHETKNEKIFHLADLFHNTPLRLNIADNAESYDDIIEWLLNRAKEKGCEKWLERRIQYVQE